MGLDLSKGMVQDNLENGVLEAAVEKVNTIQVGPLVAVMLSYLWHLKFVSSAYVFCVQFATEGAIAVLAIADKVRISKDACSEDEE